MNQVFTKNIESSPDLKQLVEQANQLLVDVLGSSAETATAEWDLIYDPRGRQLVFVQLSDHEGTANGLFTPDELRDKRHLWTRFYRLWGDLLESRSRQMAKARKAVAQLG